MSTFNIVIQGFTRQARRKSKKRKRRAVINVSSRGALQPGAYFAVYAASKAFVKHYLHH